MSGGVRSPPTSAASGSFVSPRVAGVAASALGDACGAVPRVKLSVPARTSGGLFSEPCG